MSNIIVFILIAQAVTSILCWFIGFRIAELRGKPLDGERVVTDFMDAFFTNGGVMGFFMGLIMCVIMFAIGAFAFGQIFLLYQLVMWPIMAISNSHDRHASA